MHVVAGEHRYCGKELKRKLEQGPVDHEVEFKCGDWNVTVGTVKKIHGSDRAAMIAKKSQPTPGRFRVFGHSFHPTGNTSFRYIEANMSSSPRMRGAPPGWVFCHYQQRFFPARPEAAGQDPEELIEGGQFGPPVSTLEYIELLTKCEVLHQQVVP